MKNSKKVMLGVIAGAVILGTTGCSFSFGITRSSGCEQEETIKDSFGSSYVVTRKITTLNGDKTEWIEGAPCEIVNETGQAMTGLYIVNSSDESWGDNLLAENGENISLEDGDRMCGITLTYNPEETTFDIKIDKEDGTSAEFDNCDLKDLNDPMHMEMEFTTNADGTNSVSIR